MISPMDNRNAKAAQGPLGIFRMTNGGKGGRAAAPDNK